MARPKKNAKATAADSTTLRRSDIERALYEELQAAPAYEPVRVTRAMVEQLVSSVIDRIGEALSHDKRVNIHGLGVFQRRVSKRTKARNPRTGETVPVRNRARVGFRACSSLRQAVQSPA